MIDISKDKDMIDKINQALNDGKIIEIKNERKKDKPVNITLVKIKRNLIR